jgi:hypothetical protein
MADYQLTYTPQVLRTADQVLIPNNPALQDCQAYLAWLAAGGVPDPAPAQVLSQDLMAQFTAADAALIQAAIAGNVQFWLLWSAMSAQRDPMIVTNARFLAGWSALIQVLGQPRMTAIAAALNVTIA